MLKLSIGARSWKYGKSQGRLDHTLCMHEVVRALTYACETTGSIRTFSLWERDIFPLDCFTVQEKWLKSVGESFTVRICINVLQDLSKYASLQCPLADASTGVGRLCAHLAHLQQKKNLSSLLNSVFFATCVCLRGNSRLKTLRKFNLRPLATTCWSV